MMEMSTYVALHWKGSKYAKVEKWLQNAERAVACSARRKVYNGPTSSTSFAAAFAVVSSVVP